MKNVMITFVMMVSTAAIAQNNSMKCDVYSLKNAEKLPTFIIDYNTDSGDALIKVSDEKVKASIVEITNELVHIDVSGDGPITPYYSELKKTNEAPSDLLKRVASDIITQYDLDSLNKVAAEKLPSALVDNYGSLGINTTFKMDGHYKYLMNCR